MTDTITDVKILDTRIPEGRKVTGLEYGEYVSRSSQGWAGYHVRPEGTEDWAIARLTPANDELEGDDAQIVAAIAGEL